MDSTSVSIVVFPVSTSASHSRISFSSSGTPGLDPVPSLEALEMTVDSSRTPSMLLVPSFEPPVPGYLLLIFLLSLRAFIMSAASCLAGVRVSIPLSFLDELEDLFFDTIKESQKAIPDCLLCEPTGSIALEATIATGSGETVCGGRL
ncbi:hypothetical protein Tco_0505508 [Tanacetum coccineum]